MDYLVQREFLGRRIRNLEADDFEAASLAVFRFQARFNPVYREYLALLGVVPEKLTSIADIPFLPIQLFKTHALQTGEWSPEVVFTSSGTTSQTTSRHLVRDLNFYAQNTAQGFAHFYGPVENFVVLALLPAYLERQGSSLVYMAQRFIEWSRFPESGFFLNDYAALTRVLAACRQQKLPFLLLGVSFALWDLAEKYAQDLTGGIIMETGGMKGRRQEITREELHLILRQAFQVEDIHSEYGMTELLSQAYSTGQGRFWPAPTMRVCTREVTDPFAATPPGKTGVVNIVDLANLDTISFIATEDLGKAYEDGSFEILGRLDAGDLRGCNLLVSDIKN